MTASGRGLPARSARMLRAPGALLPSEKIADAPQFLADAPQFLGDQQLGMQLRSREV